MNKTKTYYFAEDRTTYIREQLIEDQDGTEAAKDIQTSTMKVYFRMYSKSAASSLLEDKVMVKVAIAGPDYADAGAERSGVELYFAPTVAHGRVLCRLVFVDETVTTQPTPSTYREIVWAEWGDEVYQSPQPAP